MSFKRLSLMALLSTLLLVGFNGVALGSGGSSC